MRIVHINTHDVEGGAASMARLLAERQRKAGHHASLLVGRRRCGGKYFRRMDPAPSDEVAGFLGTARLEDFGLRGAFGLLDAEPVRSADLLHLHNLHSGYFNPLALPALTRSRPCLWTLHDLHSTTGFCTHPVDCHGWLEGCGDCARRNMFAPDDPSIPPLSPVERYGTGLANRIKELVFRHARLTLLCPSQWVKDHVDRSILGDHPVHVVPNGVDTRILCPGDRLEARRVLGLPLDAPIIGAAAVHGVFRNPVKDGALILETLERLWRVVPDAVFLNVGSSEIANDPRIVNLPFTTSPERLTLAYRSMDVLLHGALAETFCLVAAEAMACGIPVVAQRLGPLPEVVGHEREGLLTPPGDTETLAGALARVLGDEALGRRLGAKGRSRAVAEFDLDIVVRRVERLAEEAVRDPGPMPEPLPLDKIDPLLHSPELLAAECKDPAKALDGATRIRHFIDRLPEPEKSGFIAAAEKPGRIGTVFERREAGRMEEALELLDGLIADWPQDRALVRTRGVTLGLMGRDDEAFAVFEQCLAGADPLTEVWLNMADIHMQADRLDQWEAALTTFVGIDPNLRGVHHRLGLLHRAKGNPRAAIREFLTELRLYGAPESVAPLREAWAERHSVQRTLTE